MPVGYDCVVELADGTRERNTNERRDALVRASYALFREQGFANTTMDEVAARAGVSRRTAFRYFATKEDLVFPTMQQRTEKLTHLLVPHEGERNFDTVSRACLALARDYQAERDFLLAQWEIVRHEPSLQAREHHIEREGQAAIQAALLLGQKDTTRARRRARIHAAVIIAAVRATLDSWLEGGASTDLVRLGRETFADLEHGLASWVE